ncbi:hypothetical protein VZC37_10895, partial [Gordonia sp. LSe1-13]|nr:hypothetical protein [Gordonia sp. LSe1-13]
MTQTLEPPAGIATDPQERIDALVVRGAVLATRVRFPIPLSIRACGFPAHGLPMIFCAWLRCL